MGTLHFLPNGTCLPPLMQPCRPEMADLDCFGAGEQTWDGARPCGALVTLYCQRCGVHRCADCVLPGNRCPMCLLTDPRKYALAGVQ